MLSALEASVRDECNSPLIDADETIFDSDWKVTPLKKFVVRGELKEHEVSSTSDRPNISPKTLWSSSPVTQTDQQEDSSPFTRLLDRIGIDSTGVCSKSKGNRNRGKRTRAIGSSKPQHPPQTPSSDLTTTDANDNDNKPMARTGRNSE